MVKGSKCSFQVVLIMGENTDERMRSLLIPSKEGNPFRVDSWLGSLALSYGCFRFVWSFGGSSRKITFVAKEFSSFVKIGGQHPGGLAM